MHTTRTSTGSLAGAIPTAAPITLPALTDWKHQQESPEAQPGFDDSTWQVADKTTTNSVTGLGSLPVLYADDYGFHTGSTWYRGRFTTRQRRPASTWSPTPAAARRRSRSGSTGPSSAAPPTGSGDFTFPAGSLKPTGDNVLSVLTVNMGHEEDYNSTNGNKSARGLTSASLLGAPLTSVTWRLQGVRGGEQEIDPVRGPLSTGGLYGERAGWHAARLRRPELGERSRCPTTDTTPGVVLVPHQGRAAPAEGPGHLARPDHHRRPVAEVPRAAVRQRLDDRQLRQLPRPAAQLPDPERHPEHGRQQHHRDRGVEPGRHHRRARARSRSPTTAATPPR